MANSRQLEMPKGAQTFPLSLNTEVDCPSGDRIIRRDHERSNALFNATLASSSSQSGTRATAPAEFLTHAQGLRPTSPGQASKSSQDTGSVDLLPGTSSHRRWSQASSNGDEDFDPYPSYMYTAPANLRRNRKDNINAPGLDLNTLDYVLTWTGDKPYFYNSNGILYIWDDSIEKFVRGPASRDEVTGKCNYVCFNCNSTNCLSQLNTDPSGMH